MNHFETSGFAPSQLTAAALIEFEHMAVRLARLAGERIVAAFGTSIDVQFKPPGQGHAANSNPVSQVDRSVEKLIRTELAARYPEHAVLGEEGDASPPADAPLIWTIDPLDGTTNFINGLPLFSSSIGVLYRGYPVAGAIWCSTSHTLRAGVYHARHDATLCFDEAPVSRRESAAWRGLASEPGATPILGKHWDTRVMGSAALECAFVAIGLLRLAYLRRPRIWDVAAGLCLARSSGCKALTRADAEWIELGALTSTTLYHQPTVTLRDWAKPVLIGAPEDITLAVEAFDTR